MSAEYLKIKTPGGVSAQGKPRVYFTCHADDFERSFDKICEKLFEAQECAVYYTSDMDFIIQEENRATDMERMNLFVIPVSLKLLTTPNRAMDFDFKYALEKHIPVLPIMIEPGLDPVYSREDKFGSRQYLDMVTIDSTAISFEEKLKKYLSAVLIDDKTAERVRAAFDAYIFLSYRKKDRHYANELMRLIHKNPICRDIAIWYDEFLTPGENFNDAIEKALEKSELFTLLVTPNLVNEKNYVQTTEYPAAKKAKKDILPAEMEPTDEEELQMQYKDIPECVNTNDDEEFRRRLLESVSRFALMENDEDPEHNFLIGLAYLEGIDVEVDRQRALELNEKVYPLCLKVYCEEHPDTLISLNNFACTYSDLGQHKKALELHKKAYELRCKVLGEEHPKALTSLSNLAFTYGNMGNFEKESALEEKVYELRCKVLGENHPDTLTSLANLALTYGDMGNFEKEAELEEKLYKLRCKVLGKEHSKTLTTLNNLAYSYCEVGKFDISVELFEKCYALRKKVLGETAAATLSTYSNLARAYNAAGNYEKVLSICDKIAEYGAELSRKIINRLSGIYEEHGLNDKAQALLARLS